MAAAKAVELIGVFWGLFAPTVRSLSGRGEASETGLGATRNPIKRPPIDHPTGPAPSTTAATWSRRRRACCRGRGAGTWRTSCDVTADQRRRTPLHPRQPSSKLRSRPICTRNVSGEWFRDVFIFHSWHRGREQRRMKMKQQPNRANTTCNPRGIGHWRWGGGLARSVCTRIIGLSSRRKGGGGVK